MAGRTATEAYFERVNPIQEALNLITAGRLTVGWNAGGIRVGVPETVVLNNRDPAVLRSTSQGRLLLSVGLQVITESIEVGRGAFDCQVVGYWYTLYTANDQEILSYHWTPTVSGNQRPFPHLHIGSVITAQSRMVSDRFNKLHLPTGIVSVPSLVRCAIEEFDVEVRTGSTREQALVRLEALARAE